MSDECRCTLCEMGVPPKKPIAIRIEPQHWAVWYVSPELADQLSKLLVESNDFVTEPK